MSICEYCKKEYSNLSALNHHQKTAVFCLKIQKSLTSLSNTNLSLNNEENKTNNLTICEYCNKDFSTKFKLASHLHICKQKEIYNLKKEYELKLENSKKEYELIISSLKKEHKKEIETKNEYIQSLNKQINTYIEKTTSNMGNNNSVSTTNNNNIVNTINIKEEEFTKLFGLIKPMLPDNINKSMRCINYQQMVDVIEELDEYFINEFVKNFKDYLFTTDVSRGIVVIKLENGDSSKIQAQQFILNCFKIGEKELRQLFKAVEHYLFSLHENEEMSDLDYAINKEKLKDLEYFVFNEKPNKIVKKIASKLLKNSIILSNQKSTDNKVIEDEILKLH